MGKKFNYAKAYKKLHMKSEDVFSGKSLLPHIDEIGKIIIATKSKTLLDYGCGKARPYIEDRVHDKWGVPMPTLYDIGVPAFAKYPRGKFDGVICTDVLEHIAEADVPIILSHLFGFASRFLFLSIATRPAKKTFPNGRNVHLTVKDRGWWSEKLKECYPIGTKTPDILIRVVYMDEA